MSFGGLKIAFLLSVSISRASFVHADSQVHTLEVNGADFVCSLVRVVAHNASTKNKQPDASLEVQWIGGLTSDKLSAVIQEARELNPTNDPAIARGFAEAVAGSLTPEFLAQHEGMFIRVVGRIPIGYTSDRSLFESWNRARRQRSGPFVYRTIFIQQGKPTVLHETYYGESPEVKSAPSPVSTLSEPVILVDLNGEPLRQARDFALATRARSARIIQAIRGIRTMDPSQGSELQDRYVGKRLLLIAHLPFAVTEDNSSAAAEAMSVLGRKRGFEAKGARITLDGFVVMDGTTPRLIVPGDDGDD